MKKQKLNRTLVLNKKTVSNLEGWEMNQVNGGIAPTFRTTCMSDYATCKTYEMCSCGDWCM